MEATLSKTADARPSGLEASQLPLSSLCGYPTASAMLTPVPGTPWGQRLVGTASLPQNNLIWSGYWG